jgi:hypothetical protein
MTRKVVMDRFLALRVTGRVMRLFVVTLALAFRVGAEIAAAIDPAVDLDVSGIHCLAELPV